MWLSAFQSLNSGEYLATQSKYPKCPPKYLICNASIFRAAFPSVTKRLGLFGSTHIIYNDFPRG